MQKFYEHNWMSIVKLTLNRSLLAIICDLTCNRIINVKNTFVNGENKYFYFTFGFHNS